MRILWGVLAVALFVAIGCKDLHVHLFERPEVSQKTADAVEKVAQAAPVVFDPAPSVWWTMFSDPQVLGSGALTLVGIGWLVFRIIKLRRG